MPIRHDNKANRGEPLLIAGITAAAVSLGLYIAAIMLPWGSETANKSLASSPSSLAFNIPALVVVFIATLLALRKASRPAAVVLLALFSLEEAIGLTDSTISVFALSKEHAGPGMWTSLLSLLASLAGTGLLAVVSQVRFRISSHALLWATAGLVSAGMWVAGEWLPWTQTTYHLNAPFTFHATGTKTLVQKCCIPFQNVAWPAMLREALTMLVILVAVIAVNFLTPRWLAGAAMSALGVLYLADNFDWFASTIANPTVDPSSLPGRTAAEITQQGFVVTQQGLFGGWLALSASMLLIIVGAFRTIGALGKVAVETSVEIPFV